MTQNNIKTYQCPNCKEKEISFIGTIFVRCTNCHLDMVEVKPTISKIKAEVAQISTKSKKVDKCSKVVKNGIKKELK